MPPARPLGALLLGLALLAGCKDRRLAQMEAVRAEVCRCKDAECVDAALARMPNAGPRSRREGQKLAARILECVAAVGELTPETAPEAPPEDPAGASAVVRPPVAPAAR